MAKNELMAMKESTFDYDFRPAEIEIKNYEGLVERADMVADHYENLVLKDSTLSEVNQTHLELNRFVKGLEESRLNVKRQYNEPLKEFEEKIKSVVKTLEKPLQVIKDTRDEILDKEEQAREEALIDYLNRRLQDSDIKIKEVEIEDGWTNKGNWTEKLSPRKKLTEEIDQEINRLEKELKKRQDDRKVLEAFLNDKEMEHEGWVSQLEYKDSIEIIQDIQRAEEARKEREKREERRKELEIERREERKVEMEERKKRAKEAAAVAEEFGQEAEEIEEVEEIQEAIEPEERLVTDRIKVTGTIRQLSRLNEFLKANEIKVEPIIDEEDLALDDLPF